MTLVADEGVDQAIVLRLRAEGYYVVSIAEGSPSINDNAVLDLANRLQSVLVTVDKDFGELVFRQRLAHFGVVLLRLEGIPREVKTDTVVQAIRAHGTEMLHSFSVISPNLVRIRRLADDS